MRVLHFAFLLFVCLAAVAFSEEEISQSQKSEVFVRQARGGRCFVPKGGNCYRCDCKPGTVCVKGTCVKK